MMDISCKQEKNKTSIILSHCDLVVICSHSMSKPILRGPVSYIILSQEHSSSIALVSGLESIGTTLMVEFLPWDREQEIYVGE